MESGMRWKAPLVVMGMGQSKEDVPSSYRSILTGADVVIGGRRLLAQMGEMSASKMVLAPPLSSSISLIKGLIEDGKKVVVLCDGDPLLFGLGNRLVREFPPSCLWILPNVSIPQRAGAYLGISVKEMELVSLHGREDVFPLLNSISKNQWTGVYTDHIHSPSFIAGLVLDKGISGGDVKMHVFERLGWKGESYEVYLPSQCLNRAFKEPNFVILERTPWPPPEMPHLGMEEGLFVSDGGQITKSEVRSLCVATLSPLDNKVIWDLGAGCGSVSVEIMAISNNARVYAVEKEKTRVEMIKENRRRFGLYSLEVIWGDIIEVIPSLPSPHRIFIGGGLSDGIEILEMAWERLLQGGKVVISLVLMQTLYRCMEFCEKRDISFQVKALHLDRGEPLGRGMRFVPLNPVIIFSMEKKA